MPPRARSSSRASESRGSSPRRRAGRARRACSSALQLQRERVVGGPQQPDRDRARDERGRDQARRREVVVRAEPNASVIAATSTSDDATRPTPGAALARGVEPRLPEDEPRDRDEERQPLRRAGLPEQAPEDRVAEDDAAEDERRVEAERQADRVEPRERSRSRARAGRGRASGAAGEDVRPRPRGRRGRGAPSSRRLGGLGRHGDDVTRGVRAANDRRDGVRPRLDGVAGDDAAAQLRARLAPDRRRRPRRGATRRSARPRRRAAGSGAATGRPSRNSVSAALLATHRHAARRRPRRRPCRASRSRAAASRSGAHRRPRAAPGSRRAATGGSIRTRSRSSGEAATICLQLGPVRALVVGQLRPADLELRVEPARDGQLERLQHRRRSPSSAPSGRARAAAAARSGCAAVGRREAVDVDRVTDPVQLRRSRAGTSGGRR